MSEEQFVIPQEIWQKWETPEYDVLRQTVIVFGGNTSKEAPVEKFADVSLLFQEGEGTNLIKGIMYLTTRRMVFLPENQIPHPHLVQCTYESLRSLSGIRNDLSIYLTDRNGGTANFKFQTANTLFQCFNLLRFLAESTKLESKNYKKAMFDAVTAKKRDETPFTSIEFDLGESKVTKAPEINAPKLAASEEDLEQESQSDPLMNFLQPIKHVLDYCNHLHFDIHIKLRILLLISVITFILKFIPLLPLTALLVICVQLYFVYENIKNKNKEDEDVTEKFSSWEIKEPVKQTESFGTLRKFIKDWLMWGNTEKSSLLLKVCLCLFFGWTVLPFRLYFTLCILCYGYFLIRPILKSDILGNIVNGFWFST